MFHRTARASDSLDEGFWLALAPAEASELARVATEAAATDAAHLDTSESQLRIRDALAGSVTQPSPALYVVVARGFEYAQALALGRRPLSPERRTAELTREDLHDGLFLALTSAPDGDLHVATSEWHAVLNSRRSPHRRRNDPARSAPQYSFATIHSRFIRSVEDELHRGLGAL